MAARPTHRPTRRQRPWRALAPVVAVVALLGACTGDDGDGAAGTTLPPPPVIPAEDAATPTIPVPDGFVAPDTRGVVLRPVVGDAPPAAPSPEANTLPLTGGEAELRVRVVGPNGGAVPGAVVRFERLAGSQRGWADLVANKGGLAVLTDALGGRYRIRAWEAPRFTATESQVLFVAHNEGVDLQVRVDPHEAPVLQGALTVPTWRVADTVAFEALLVQESVDGDGIIRGEPLAADLTLTPIAGARVDTDNPVPTDPATGRATFGVVCLLPGIHQAILTGRGLTTRVELPDCRPSDVPPPPSPGTEATEPPGTPPPSGAATTTTTAPDPPAFPVGETFTPPFDGPVPAGTYAAVDPSGTCTTSYEVLRGGRWIRQQTTGRTLVLTAQARRFRAVGDTTPCTFGRTR